MDSIVSQLSEIEAAAAAIVEKAEAGKSDLEKEIQTKRDRFDAELEQTTREKLSKIQADLEVRCSAILQSQEGANNDLLAALDNDYNKNHERYAQELFQHIIEV